MPGPTLFAHCDNSEKGSLPILQNNMPASEFARWSPGHWAIINVWRLIVRPVNREPLALLDASTVGEDDFVGVWAASSFAGQGDSTMSNKPVRVSRYTVVGIPDNPN